MRARLALVAALALAGAVFMPTAAALDRAAYRVTDHPGPTTRALQRAVMACLLEVAFLGFHIGRRLTRPLR